MTLDYANLSSSTRENEEAIEILHNSSNLLGYKNPLSLDFN